MLNWHAGMEAPPLSRCTFIQKRLVVKYHNLLKCCLCMCVFRERLRSWSAWHLRLWWMSAHLLTWNWRMRGARPSTLAGRNWSCHTAFPRPERAHTLNNSTSTHLQVHTSHSKTSQTQCGPYAWAYMRLWRTMQVLTKTHFNLHVDSHKLHDSLNPGQGSRSSQNTLQF